jgi:hypothetical protein
MTYIQILKLLRLALHVLRIVIPVVLTTLLFVVLGMALIYLTA